MASDKLVDNRENELKPASNWFRNRGLFSDHFIQERLPAWEEWGVDAELTSFHTGLNEVGWI